MLELHQLLGSEVIEVGRDSDKAGVIQELHGLLADAVDIHHAATGKMFDASLELWRASPSVGAHPCSFAVFADERCAACRTMGDKPYRGGSRFAAVLVNSGYLRYDFAALFHI